MITMERNRKIIIIAILLALGFFFLNLESIVFVIGGIVGLFLLYKALGF